MGLFAEEVERLITDSGSGRGPRVAVERLARAGSSKDSPDPNPILVLLSGLKMIKLGD